MENKSAGGACIRVNTRIGVGSKLSIQGRWEQISGVAKYCRSVGARYLVGIQRDPLTKLPRDQPIPRGVAIPAVKGSSGPPESRPISDASVVIREAEMVSITGTSKAELQTNWPIKAKEIGKERKPMQRKWSELVRRHNEQEKVSGNGNGDSKGKEEHGAAESAVSSAGGARDEITSFPAKLVRVEDIYRIAGIMNPRSGYSIGKVVEMLRSEYMRELSKEAKRAAVLMALDVAGVPLDEVLKDAEARQDALESYEAEQRNAVEAEWERKEQENAQTQAELERVKEHYMTRIARNLDGVAREKTAFNSWLAMKQQESQSIAEAAELCMKSSAPEPVASSLPAASRAAAFAGPL